MVVLLVGIDGGFWSEFAAIGVEYLHLNFISESRIVKADPNGEEARLQRVGAEVEGSNLRLYLITVPLGVNDHHLLEGNEFEVKVPVAKN